MIPGMSVMLSEGAAAPTVAVTEVAFVSEGSSNRHHHFAGVSFGPSFANRWILVIIFQQNNLAAATPISSLVIGGVSVSSLLYDHGEFRNSPPALVGTAIARCQPSGTSGDITFTTSNNSLATVAVLSVIGFDLSTASDSQFIGAVTASSSSITMSIPSGGMALAANCHYGGSSTSWSGLAVRRDQTVGSARVSYAYGYNLTGGSLAVTASFGSTVTILTGQSFARA